MTLEMAPRANSRKGIKVAVFVASFVATMVGLEALFTVGTPAGMPPFALFPVVVVTPPTVGDVEIRTVLYKGLEEFRRTHPGTTYLVPPGDVKRLRAQLTDESFTVTQLENGRQAFKVRKWLYSEAYVIGWYEASAKEFFPTRWARFHDVMRAFFLMPALVVSVVTTWIAGELLPWIGRVARRTS